jgi:hypothetical protein
MVGAVKEVRMVVERGGGAVAVGCTGNGAMVGGTDGAMAGG